jgi:hypothetical protein
MRSVAIMDGGRGDFNTMNTTNQIRPLTHEQKVAILKTLISWMEENKYHAAALRTKNQLEKLRQYQRCSERA